MRLQAQSAEQAERSRWERTRAQVVAALSPYVKGGVDPRKILPLPWDASRERARTDIPGLTREEIRSRYRAAAAKAGL